MRITYKISTESVLVEKTRIREERRLELIRGIITILRLLMAYLRAIRAETSCQIGPINPIDGVVGVGAVAPLGQQVACLNKGTYLLALKGDLLIVNEDVSVRCT